MVFTVRNPFPDSETQTKEISQLIETFIKDNWDETMTTVSVNDVSWGSYGDRILQVDEPITLRSYSIFEDARPLTHNQSRWRFQENQIIDVYVLNNEEVHYRDPRAIAIKKFFDMLFLVNQGNSYKGIYEFRYRGSRLDNDVEATNITRIKALVELTWVLDIVNV